VANASATGMTTVIYVAGYGRSGSTLLALLLGTHPDIRSLGELGMIWDQLEEPGAECSCGASLESCETWGPIRRQVLSKGDLKAITRDAVVEEHCLWRLCPGLRRIESTYRDVHQLLLTFAAGTPEVRHVVDSSKTAYRFAWRPLALFNRCGIDIRIVHLIRHPSRVLASCMKGRNRLLARALPDRRRFEVARTLVGWNLANLFAALNGRILGPERYIRVDFDELLHSPRAQLSRIGQFLEIDLEPVAARVRDGEVIPSGHLISGNRMARTGDVRINAEVDGSLRLRGAWARFAVSLLSLPIYRFLRPVD
jgi:hypothetical protein